MRLKLVTFSTSLCTIGKLYDDKNHIICFTMEKPWQNNEAERSCVPAGVYRLLPTVSPKFGATYFIENKELDVSLNADTKRTHILFHPANKQSELLGCIAPCSRFGILDGEWAGLSSGNAFYKLMLQLNKEQHELEIIRN